MEQGFGHRAALKYRHLRGEARHNIGVGIVARGELARSIRNPPPLEVSVIIRSDDSSTKLKRALDSVEAQTYTNFEIIVVNDAPDGDCARWLKSEVDDLLVMHFDERQGVAASYNYGLFAASGSLIACLHVDDEWLPDYLLTQVRAFAFEPTTPVFCSSDYYVLREGSNIRERVRHMFDYSGSDVLRWHLLNATPDCASFFVAKKSDILTVAGQNEALPVGADIELQMNLLRACAETNVRRVPAHIEMPLGIKHVEKADAAEIEANARDCERYAGAIFKPLLESNLGTDYQSLLHRATVNLATRVRNGESHISPAAHHLSSNSYSS